MRQDDGFRARISRPRFIAIPEGLDEQYVRAVDSQLENVFRNANWHLRIDQLFASMKGAYPTLTNERLKATRDYPVSPSIGMGSHTEYSPELHPLDFEWYFDRASARHLSREFCARRGRTICLGTPTVASSAIRLGKSVIMVDRNPLIRRRFPVLGRKAELHIGKVEHALELPIKSQVVIFDAPWYLTDVCSWLYVASRLAVRGGIIVFSLYPPLVRATAAQERAHILRLASNIGSVSLVEDALTYDTPLFEREALACCGIPNAGNWRRGDLIVIRVKRALDRPGNSVMQSCSWNWRTFVIKEQVVKLRMNKAATAGNCMLPLEPLEGNENFGYSTVSASDPQRDAIDLWTSRNRVAHVADTSVVAEMFELLERGVAPRQAVGMLTSCAAGSRMLEHLVKATEQILMQGARQCQAL